MSRNNSSDFLANEVISRLCGSQKNNNKSNNNQNTNNDDKKCPLPNITPSQMLVIVAILGGVLEVNSVLVDRDQTVQVLLEGSLKQKDNGDEELAEMLDSIGSKSFDDVVKALINRLT